MLLHYICISGSNMNGRSALTDLAKKMSEDNDWKDLSINKSGFSSSCEIARRRRKQQRSHHLIQEMTLNAHWYN